jgi:hypothetical protein
MITNFYQVPLKAKYLARRNNTGGKYRPRSGNTNGISKKGKSQGDGPRRRSYFTHIHSR